ncbi:hypothetical protein H310_01921 [Aphanomyces invadans]|uniref:PH domain-containing protein n=1 Tax=Aphanomyces invadans TaxID=157072 RepID=A0A024ULV9_9STRA|nr:hypothetical protein H310_01921 [Aphanomyces invadans]ETW07396.1 hypothetical protein H310_01921 [Aphanomyces invadans]RHY29261.1 hypothetical protein DYB32_005290 [Aphanomyces invadans]|eukprot:XP_008863489.1 hypothetical protein H310_01921 [Aphanomyces invadans]
MSAENRAVNCPTSSTTMQSYDYAGWVYKQGSMIKSWKKRYMVLKNKQLTYFESEKVEGNSKAKGSFQVITVEIAHDIKNGLLVHGTGGRVMKLYTDTAEGCEEWINAIAQATSGQPPLVAQVSVRGPLNGSGSSMSFPPRDTRSNSSVSSLRSSIAADDDTGGCFGWLAKEGGRVKNWKRRYFSLQGRSLTYFDNANMTGAAKGNGQVCGVRINKDKPLSIDVNFEKGRVLRVTADNKDDFEKWWMCLNAAVEGRSVSRASRSSMSGNAAAAVVNVAAAAPASSNAIFRSLDSYESHEDVSIVANKYATQDSSAAEASRLTNNQSWLSSDSDDDKEDGDWL